MDPFRIIGMLVVAFVLIVGISCLTGIKVQTGPGYVGVGYTPRYDYYVNGGGISPVDDALLRNAYK